MSDGIIKILDNVCEKFGIVVNWSSDNVVPYIKDVMERFVRFRVAESVFYIILGVLSLCSLFVIYRLLKWCNRNSHEYAKRYTRSANMYRLMFVVLLSLFILFSVSGVLMVLINIHSIIELKTIPEKAFIDYVMSYRGILH